MLQTTDFKLLFFCKKGLNYEIDLRNNKILELPFAYLGTKTDYSGKT